MTQYHMMPGFRLYRSAFSTRVLITLFYASISAGLSFAWYHHAHRIGTSAPELRTYYEGNATDVHAKAIIEPPPEGKVLDVVHNHALAIPMLLFILCHFLGLTGTPEWARVAVYVLSFASAGVCVASPWILTYHGAGWAPLVLGAGLTMFACFAILVFAPLWEMWIVPFRLRASLPGGRLAT